MVAIPIQIYADPLWIQLIMDTFPVMVFATAWTWLVSFFVQLVGVALGITHPGRFEIPFQSRVNNTITSTSTLNTNTGGLSSEDVLTGSSLTASRRNTTGNNSMNEGRTEDDSPSYHSHKKPGIASIDTVIQITAYTIYGVLIILFAIFRKIAAAILIYALLCCIYAVLFGTGLYFCPRLLGLLVPGLIPTTTTTTTTTSSSGSPQNPQPNGGAKGTAAEKRNFGVVVRLSVCTLICLFVFAARTVRFNCYNHQSKTPLFCVQQPIHGRARNMPTFRMNPSNNECLWWYLHWRNVPQPAFFLFFFWSFGSGVVCSILVLSRNTGLLCSEGRSIHVAAGECGH